MSRPDYLYCHERTSPAYVKHIYSVVGDTEKYWKCLIDGSGDTFLVRKSNLKEYGIGTQFYIITAKKVAEYRVWVRLVTKVGALKAYRLSVKQLTDILKIAGEQSERENEVHAD